MYKNVLGTGKRCESDPVGSAVIQHRFEFILSNFHFGNYDIDKSDKYAKVCPLFSGLN